jgi:hypothetical protein
MVMQDVLEISTLDKPTSISQLHIANVMHYVAIRPVHLEAPHRQCPLSSLTAMASHQVSVVAKQTPTCHQHTVAVDLRRALCRRYWYHSAYLVHRLLSPTNFQTVQVLT